MNIVIVGPGAIGSLWACNLRSAGHNVSLWSRSQSNKLELQLDDQPVFEFANHQIQRLIDADLIVVTTKAGQVETALMPLLPHLNHETILLFMHNGMGAVDPIFNTIADFPLLIATTTHGALKTAPHKVQHTGKGITQIGSINKKGDQCHFISDVFAHALPDVSWCLNINNALWLKLAINCAINPLTAVLQCNNGALSAAQYKHRLNTIIDEIVQVANADGQQFEADSLRETISRVIQATAANYSSMHQDIVHGRTTEIEYITGYLLKRAQTHGLSVPENQSLYLQVKELESQRSSA